MPSPATGSAHPFSPPPPETPVPVAGAVGTALDDALAVGEPGDCADAEPPPNPKLAMPSIRASPAVTPAMARTRDLPTFCICRVLLAHHGNGPSKHPRVIVERSKLSAA